MTTSLQNTSLNDEVYEEENTQKNKFLTFHLAREDYGIEIEYVTEIICIQKITEVPDLPDYVKGVINLRGKVIPVMDMRRRFHMQDRDYDDRTCIIVVDISAAQIGLVVDEVREVVGIPEDQIEPPPSNGKEGGRQYIKGIGKMNDEVKIILDVSRILFEEELENLQENSAPSSDAQPG
jgi:purine-binding chemotaxis protein CheW